MKILITGGKSASALKLLRAFRNMEIILADYGEVPDFSSDQYRFISLGLKNEDTLAHLLLSVCLDHQADLVLPLHDFEIEPIVKSEILFAEFNISVLLPDLKNYERYLHRFPEKKGDWAVYLKGQLLFATAGDELLPLEEEKDRLNGAFYLQKNNGELNLNLITV